MRSNCIVHTIPVAFFFGKSQGISPFGLIFLNLKCPISPSKICTCGRVNCNPIGVSEVYGAARLMLRDDCRSWLNMR